MIAKKIVASVSIFLFASLFAGDLIVGVNERTNVHVNADEVLDQQGVVWMSRNSVLDKTGDGNWILPMSAMCGPDAVTINVRAGSVTLADNEMDAEPDAVPEELLGSSAVWFDAFTNICVAADGTSVISMLDVRETASAVPFDRIRAVSMTNYVQEFPQFSVLDGFPCVYFGGYKSGRWMRLMDKSSVYGVPNTTSLRSKIRHAFVIYRITGSQGYVFSVEDTNYISFHPRDSAAQSNSVIISRDGSTAPSQMAARCYVNGERCDPTVTVAPQNQFMLLEFHFCGEGGSVDGFFNDRNNRTDGGRQGGDYIGEVLFYTNTLAEVDRIRIGRHLCGKWNIPVSAGERRLVLAEGTEVSVPDSVEGVSVSGTGEMSVDGGDAPTLGYGNSEFRGTVKLSAGVPLNVRDDVYAYSVSSGDRLSVKTGLSEGCYSGDIALRTEDAGAGRIIKEGSGTAVIRGIPQDVTDVTVSAGTLSLSAPYVSPVISGSEHAASMPNPGFEQTTSGTYVFLYNNWNDGATREGSKVGWTGRILPNSDGTYYDAWAAFFNIGNTAIQSSNFAYKNYPPSPEGDWAFIFRGKGEIETEVEVPSAGAYELTFRIMDLQTALNGQHMIVEIFIGPDKDNLKRVVHTIPFSDMGYIRHSCRVDHLEAGTHILLVRTSAKDDSIYSAAVDDFKLTFIGERESGFAVPNGDFEDYISSDINDLASRFTATKDSPVGWEFTQFNWSGEESVPSAAIVRYGAQIKNTQRIANSADWERGNVQLFLASAGGAKAQTSFKPPKTGLYALRARVGEFYRSSLYTVGLTGNPVIETAVRIGDGEAVSLGALKIGTRMMSVVTWPTPVLITDTNVVMTLMVSNTVVTSAALLDDFEFVPCREALASNLLSDGGFETNNKWELVHRQGAELYNRYSNASYRGFALEYYGYDKGEGLRAISLIDFAGCYQKIRFPVSGRYRLRFITRARNDSRSPTHYSPGAAMRAVLVKGSVTNEIVSLATPTTNFVAHTVFFDVDDANGEYTFGFEAANDYRVSGYYDRMSFIDDASVVYCGDSFADGCREDIAIPEDLSISVAAGARLVADFTGTHKVKQVRLGGRRVSGLISAATHPDSISGIGMFYVQPKGTCIHLR